MKRASTHRGMVTMFLGSITAKVAALTVAAAVIGAGAGVVGLQAVGQMRDDMQTATVIQEALHNQGELDGASHAGQYDALAASVSSGDALEEHLDALKDHREQLTGSVAANQQLLASIGHDALLDKAFAEVHKPLAAYDAALADVQKSIEAGTPVTAEQIAAVDEAWAGFDEPFDGLSEAMGAFIDNLDATSQKDADDA